MQELTPMDFAKQIVVSRWQRMPADDSEGDVLSEPSNAVDPNHPNAAAMLRAQGMR